MLPTLINLSSSPQVLEFCVLLNPLKLSTIRSQKSEVNILSLRSSLAKSTLVFGSCYPKHIEFKRKNTGFSVASNHNRVMSGHKKACTPRNLSLTCSLMPEITSRENNVLYSTIRSKSLNADFSGRENTMIALILKYKSMILKGMEKCITISLGRARRTHAIFSKHIQSHYLVQNFRKAAW